MGKGNETSAKEHSTSFDDCRAMLEQAATGKIYTLGEVALAAGGFLHGCIRSITIKGQYPGWALIIRVASHGEMLVGYGIVRHLDTLEQDVAALILRAEWRDDKFAEKSKSVEK